tara:strand:+ start:242 stop:484 length:243 start_codon:yes stop_codon:yes gene_type:complete
MRNLPLKGILNASPVKQKYDFTKKKNYSPEATKNTFAGRNIHRVIPKNTSAGILGAIAGGGVLKNAPKIIKAIKTYTTSS